LLQAQGLKVFITGIVRSGNNDTGFLILRNTDCEADFLCFLKWRFRISFLPGVSYAGKEQKGIKKEKSISGVAPGRKRNY